MKTIVKLKKGFGYWDVTNYPLGGKFCRDSKPLLIILVSTLDSRYSKGCTDIGTTLDNRKVAFNIQHTWDFCEKCGKKSQTEFCQVDETSGCVGTYLCEECC